MRIKGTACRKSIAWGTLISFRPLDKGPGVGVLRFTFPAGEEWAGEVQNQALNLAKAISTKHYLKGLSQRKQQRGEKP